MRAVAGRESLRRFRSAVVFPVLDALFPADCFVCARPLPLAQLRGACPGCWSELRPIRQPYCPSCGLPRPPGTDLLGPAGGRCAACLARPPELDGARAAVSYDALARRFLGRAKLQRRSELLAVFGAQLASVLLADGFASSCDRIVPVPAHPWSRLRRGFDTAEGIAAEVARRLGRRLDRRCLRRRLRPYAPAKRLAAASRRRLLRSAFRAHRHLPGDRVLVVDDVMTTGATAGACARALRGAGASSVAVAVWARTPPPP